MDIYDYNILTSFHHLIMLGTITLDKSASQVIIKTVLFRRYFFC